MDWVNPRYTSNADLDGTNDSLMLPISETGRPELGRLYTVPAREGRAVRLLRGERLRIHNPRGTQVCDFWAFCDAQMHEHLSMEHVRAWLSRTIPRVGDELVSNRRRPMLALLEDTSPGVHDTLIAACDLPRYRTLGVPHYHDNCCDNLRMALKAIGCHTDEVPSPLNLWMNNPVGVDGEIGWRPPVATAGDHVVLGALVDCIAVMSACPQDLVPVNGEDCMPMEITFDVLAA